MKLPSFVIEIVEQSSKNNPEDVMSAVESAIRSIRGSEGYEDLVDTLLRHAVQELVYATRHQKNRAMRNDSGYYGGPAKVVVGEGIVKQNATGPYRRRYDDVKETVSLRDDWTRCKTCDGGNKSKKCASCGGKGRVYKHCHLHAMLLATKLLLKNLWIEWNPSFPDTRHPSDN